MTTIRQRSSICLRRRWTVVSERSLETLIACTGQDAVVSDSTTAALSSKGDLPPQCSTIRSSDKATNGAVRIDRAFTRQGNGSHR